AAGYAVLAGFSVPTQRTLYMLGCMALMLLWRRLIVGSGVLAAAGYAVLAGFSVPTQRTLYMLGCMALMLLWRR
ncbi:ComEC/Rec2 family competence protein, partial [Aquitalea magnusonii]|uniref:ComEC/Rec2 family competence protein n=1 Tax=Aquitalea magnusonii TaxID=332411 RepID=UPI000A8A02AF